MASIFDTASLIWDGRLSGYAAGKLFPLKPNVKDLTGDFFTVTRNGTAWYLDKDGVYKQAAANVPRIEYNANGTYRGLLVEPGATNLALRSQEFESGSWNKTGVGTGLAPVVTQNVAVAPDGTTTADLIVFDRGAGNTITDRSVFAQAPTVVNATAYTASFFLKAATAGDVGKQIAIRGVAGSGYGVITLTANWVRYERTETSVSTTGNIELASRGTVTADNTVSVHAWQAQLETGPVATSPIVTTGSTAARVADVISLTSASSLIGQSAGTVFVDIEQNVGGNTDNQLITISDSTPNNRFAIRGVANRQFEARIVNGGVAQATITSAVLTGVFYRLSLAYATDDIAFYINGSQTGTDSLATIPATSQINLGANVAGGGILNGWIRSVALFPTRIPNEILTSITTL